MKDKSRMLLLLLKYNISAVIMAALFHILIYAAVGGLMEELI